MRVPRLAREDSAGRASFQGVDLGEAARPSRVIASSMLARAVDVTCEGLSTNLLTVRGSRFASTATLLTSCAESFMPSLVHRDARNRQGGTARVISSAR